MEKYCPDLTGYKDVKPNSLSADWTSCRVPISNPCIKKQCAAYKNGICMRYGTVIDIKLSMRVDEKRIFDEIHYSQKLEERKELLKQKEKENNCHD